MVCVCPGRLPANVIVAPTSPRALAQESAIPAASDGHSAGRTMRRRMVHRSAPSVAAASSSRRSTIRRPDSRVTTRNGIETKVAANTTAAGVNGTLTPVTSATGPPRSPLRPNAASSPTPPTTGGRTMGRTARARTNDRPGNSQRASSSASGTPSRTDRARAASDVVSDSRSACSTTGSASRGPSRDQGVRTASPTSGRTRSTSATTPATTVVRGGPTPTVRDGRCVPEDFMVR